jgi:hypothetical protein
VDYFEKKRTEPITWEDIYHEWRCATCQVDLPETDDPSLWIYRKREERNFGSEWEVRWLPRRLLLSDKPTLAWMSAEERAGPVLTAEVLWDVKKDAELCALIWLKAIVRHECPPTAGRRDLFARRVVGNFPELEEVLEATRPHIPWHHKSEAVLPIIGSPLADVYDCSEHATLPAVCDWWDYVKMCARFRGQVLAGYVAELSGWSDIPPARICYEEFWKDAKQLSHEVDRSRSNWAAHQDYARSLAKNIEGEW